MNLDEVHEAYNFLNLDASEKERLFWFFVKVYTDSELRYWVPIEIENQIHQRFSVENLKDAKKREQYLVDMQTLLSMDGIKSSGLRFNSNYVNSLSTSIRDVSFLLELLNIIEDDKFRKYPPSTKWAIIYQHLDILDAKKYILKYRKEFESTSKPQYLQKLIVKVLKSIKKDKEFYMMCLEFDKTNYDNPWAMSEIHSIIVDKAEKSWLPFILPCVKGEFIKKKIEKYMNE